MRSAVLHSPLPGAEEREHWGKPSFRIRDKIFVVIREAEGTLVVKVRHEDRMALTSLEPEIYSVPPTFTNTSYMIVRMDLIGSTEMRGLLEQAWRCVAAKRAIASYEAERNS